MTEPYYQDEHVSLFLGDCREVTAWLDADVLLTDPPYGRKWHQGWTKTEKSRRESRPHKTITGDKDTKVRDTALGLWGGRVAVVFGDLIVPAPHGAKQCLVYRKPPGAGSRGAFAGFRRDVEGIFLCGPWQVGMWGRSSVLESGERLNGGRDGAQARYGHPHAKPVDVLEQLLAACPPGVVADPFAGSGSTLIAARNQGRRAVGVEIEEKYAEAAARRLSQCALQITPELGWGCAR